MNWFDVLKEQRQVARTTQSFKPIQLDKPIKIKKPDNTTCRDRLIELYRKALNSFPDGKRTDEDKNDKEYDLRIRHKFEYDEGVVEVSIMLPHEGVLPDEVYCRLLNEFEKVEKAGMKDSSQVFVDYQYIDYNLKEPKLVFGDSEMSYEYSEFGTSELGFYTWINDSPSLHPGQSIIFSVEYISKEKTIEEGVNAYTGSPILRHKTLRDFKNWRGLF